MEKGSLAVDNFFQETDSVIVSSICLPEIISALTRLRREKKIGVDQYGRCKKSVIEDFASFEVYSLSAEILNRSIVVLEQTALRAADALHIASAMESKAAIFVSGDKRQLLAAKQFNLMVNLV